MVKQYYTSLLIWLSLLIGEFHTLWEGSTKKANWILTRDVTMPVQWNVKYVADEVWFILMALAVLNYKPNGINKATVKAYLIFCVADMALYFYNYKQEGWGIMYPLLLISWILIYNYGGRNTTADRQGVAY